MRGAWKYWSAALLAAAQAAGQPPAAPSASPAAEADALFELGRNLFEQLAPPEIKAQFEFPSKEQWDAFGVRLQQALEGESLGDLAAFLPEARAALLALRTLPGYEDYADWLEQRIDELEVAEQVTQMLPAPPAPTPPAPTPGPQPPPKAPPQPKAPAPKAPAPTPKQPAPTPKQSTPPPAPKLPAITLSPSAPASSAALRIPHYDLWLARVRERPTPARAATLMPRLRAAFVAEGLPPELAWLAEAESSLNPAARSPAGAKGLFQLMPATAQSLGLDTFLPDERTDPDKSARAAARYLRTLHGRFGNWPLALAAYNAGEGRVSRTLAARRGKEFADIADNLPAETRMYVPKVCALIAARAGVAPEKLAAPRAL
jgi:membrane-bound lytic murein transglycosylase D